MSDWIWTQWFDIKWLWRRCLIAHRFNVKKRGGMQG